LFSSNTIKQIGVIDLDRQVTGIGAVPVLQVSYPYTVELNDVVVTPAPASAYLFNTSVLTYYQQFPATTTDVLFAPHVADLLEQTTIQYINYRTDGSVISSVAPVRIPSQTTDRTFATTFGKFGADGTINEVQIAVTAGDGLTKRTYRFIYTRLRNNAAATFTSNPTITGFTATGTPAVNYGTAAAPLSFVSNNGAVAITPVLSDSEATILMGPVTGGRRTALNGKPFTVFVPVGGPYEYDAIVTAQDGVTSQKYRFFLTRIPANANLTSIVAVSNIGPLPVTSTIGGSVSNFDVTSPSSTYYVNVGTSLSNTVNQQFQIAEIGLIPFTSDPKADVKYTVTTCQQPAAGVTSGLINGAVCGTPSTPVSSSPNIAVQIPVPTVESVVQFIITGSDNAATRTYTVYVVRRSGDNYLSGLTVGSGT